MYVNYNAKSSGVQYSYAENRTKDRQQSKSVDVRVTYSNSSLTISDDKTMKAMPEKNVFGASDKNTGEIEAYIRKTLTRLMEKLTEHTSKALRGQSENVLAEIRTYSVSVEITMANGSSSDSAAQQDTQNPLTAENGYFGVEKTSDRIFDFAVSVFGDDPEKLEKAKEAVTKGFEAVKAAFGDSTPQITYDTYDATISKLDNYIDYLGRNTDKAYA